MTQLDISDIMARFISRKENYQEKKKRFGIIREVLKRISLHSFIYILLNSFSNTTGCTYAMYGYGNGVFIECFKQKVIS